MTHSGNPIQISRRTLALALAAAAALGAGTGALAAPPSASRAAAPTACSTFASEVASALKDLSVVVSVEGSYASFIPKAYRDGRTRDGGAYAAIGRQLGALVTRVQRQNAAFAKLQAPLIANEKACLG